MYEVAKSKQILEVDSEDSDYEVENFHDFTVRTNQETPIVSSHDTASFNPNSDSD